MAQPEFKDYFSAASNQYSRYRPRYPNTLVDVLAKLCDEHELVWDCGCGTGQLSILLAERFKAVIATDASAAQLQRATPHPRITYRTALAEDSQLPTACANLVTVAQAAHWFDLERFYAEAKRVSRPHAVIALITYGMLQVDAAVDEVLRHFYDGTLGPYWPPERRIVEEGYASLLFPFQKLETPQLLMEEAWGSTNWLDT